LAASDPLWAILSTPSKRGGRWDLAEFLETGEREVSKVIEVLQSLHLRLNFDLALDFGCGVGRLSQALARRFSSVYGIDIAPSMIEKARELNRFGGCQYILNERDDLSVFPSEHFDFIYSNIVLQHMEPRYARKYLAEFLLVLKKTGVLVFQLPDQPPTVALDQAAYRAQIEVCAAPRQVRAGECFEIRATIRNLSPVTWPAANKSFEGCLIRLGNHWLTQTGTIDIFDDGRSPLTCDLAPNQVVELALTARAPLRPGPHIMELDLVHKWVKWFAQDGSPTARLPIEVLPPLPAEAAAVSVDQPGPVEDVNAVMADHPRPVEDFQMEMYGIPRAEVEKFILDCGGRIAHVRETPEYSSERLAFLYVVVK
jgi:SAM-dependent methyltransferase